MNRAYFVTTLVSVNLMLIAWIFAIPFLPKSEMSFSVEDVVSYGGLLATLFSFCFSFALLILGLNILAIQKEANQSRLLVDDLSRQIEGKQKQIEVALNLNDISSETLSETLLLLQSSDLFEDVDDPILDKRNHDLWENTGHLRQIMTAIKPGTFAERIRAMREVVGGIDSSNTDLQGKKILNLIRSVGLQILTEIEADEKLDRSERHYLIAQVAGLLDQAKPIS